MEAKNALKYLWKLFSYILIAYGYYLFYVFCLDTFYRFYSFSKAQYMAVFTTAIAISISAGIWYFTRHKTDEQES